MNREVKRILHNNAWLHSTTFLYGAALFLLCLVAIPLILLFSSHHTTQTNSPYNQSILPQEEMITLTNAGFTPQRVLIAKGTAVRWTNDSNAVKASVNSDNYPTNRLYPELNLGQFIKGSTLVHVFLAAGKYTYHNQFNPQQKGEIDVQ